MVMAVAVGANHSAAVDSDGRLWTWGRAGPWLGHGNGSRTKRGKSSDNHTSRRSRSGSRSGLWGGPGIHEPNGDESSVTIALGPPAARRIYCPAMNSRKVVSIAAGDGHTLVATRDGRVFVWGQGESGCLGLGTDVQVAARPTQVPGVFRAAVVEAGPQHSVVIASLSAPPLFSPALPTVSQMEAESDDVRLAVR